MVTPVPQSTSVGNSAASAQAGPSSGISLPPEIMAFIAQSVQAAMVAEWAKTSSLPAMSFTSFTAIGGGGGRKVPQSQHQQQMLLNHLQVGLFQLFL